MRNFIRYFLILTFLCVLPVFVLADGTEPTSGETDTVSLKIKVDLLQGSTDGTFHVKITDQNGKTVSVTDEDGNVISGEDGIPFLTNGGTITRTIYGLTKDTEYTITELTVPSTHEFVSIKSGDKIITNAQIINIKTGDAGTVTEVTITNASKISSGIEHNKNIESNKNGTLDDGTYRLSLSVTGQTDVTIERTNANVLLVYDTSSSMRDQKYYVKISGEPSVTQWDNGKNYWGIVNGMYKRLYYAGGKWRTGSSSTSPEYTRDDFYEESSVKRAYSAEVITNEFISDLLGASDSMVNLALVTFNESATEEVGWTNNNVGELDDETINNVISNNNYLLGKFSNTGNTLNLTYASETNWQDAMAVAETTLKKLKNSNPTYVVFITDGQPTNVGGDNETGWLTSYKAAAPDALKVKELSTLFAIYAFGDSRNYLDDLMYYVYNPDNFDPETDSDLGTMEPLPDNCYSASDDVALRLAIKSIFHKIVETAGFNSVSISDGTTSQVHVESGDMSLLNVDKDSFKYWLSVPVTEITDAGSAYDWKFMMTDRESGSDYWVNLDINGTDAMAVWTIGDTDYVATLPNCSVEDGIFKYEWKNSYDDDNSFYDKEPPQASYVGGAVKWDLASVGTLLNDVTYTVTFDVWPTQYANDLIVDLTNGTITYNSLPDDIRDYIVDNKNGTYTLRTNTEALVTYTDSRNSSGPQTTTFNKIDGVATPKDSVTVEKQWNNTLDSHGAKEFDQIDVNLLKNGTVHEKITLTDTNSWRNSIFISPGLMKTIDGKFISLETGNKYTFKEDTFYPKDDFDGDGYHWDLRADTIRPMYINGESVMLILVDETSKAYLDNPLTDEEKDILDDIHFLEKGTDKYYKICTINKEDDEDSCLEEIYKVGNPIVLLTNYRRNYLNITKEIVDDNDIVIEDQVDDEFIFALTVTDPNGDDIYFSTRDNKNKVTITNNIISGVVSSTPTDKGYYIVHSGDTVILKLKNKWNVRFINLPNGSTYTFSEVLNGQSPAGYVFRYATIFTPGIPPEEDTTVNVGVPLINNQLIDRNNTSYQVTYYNKYESTSVTVDKVWVVSDNVLGKDIIDASKTAVIELSNNLDDTKRTIELNIDKNDNTYTWDNLPKYKYDASGNLTTYSYTANEIKVKQIIGTGEDAIVREFFPTIENDITKFYIKDYSIDATIGAWVLSKGEDGFTFTNTWEPSKVGKIDLKKVSFDDRDTGLNGAVFVLYRYIGEGTAPTTIIDLDDPNLSNNWIKIGETTSNPYVIFNNLYEGNDGKYRLIEIVAPGNYILPRGQWAVSISPNADGTLTASYSGIDNPPTIGIDNLIYNQQVPEMPSTGGFGIYELSIFGLFLMMIGTIAFAISQRKLI